MEQPLLQHQEWVKFQQSISVDGFQTGQVTFAKVVKKSKGGIQVRRKRERELALQKQGDLRLEKFPAIRYSPEETEKLLEEAYKILPKRAGKRGTRRLNRQQRRWFLVRKIHSKHKAYRYSANERKMEKRREKRQKVVILKESVPATRQRELGYQEQILRRWAQTMVEDQASEPNQHLFTRLNETK